MTSVDESVVLHVKGRKELSGQISDPITKLVMTSGQETAFFIIQGVGYGETNPTTITVVEEIGRIYSIVEE